MNVRGLHEARARSPRSTRSSRRPARSEVTAIGYCLGGTLLAATLAYMAASGDDRIKAGDLLHHAGRLQGAGRARRVHRRGAARRRSSETMSKRGYLEGSEMATTFNMLRANDLIWSFVVNNYLLGKDPFPFDLLYWNSDTTRMPAAMHSFYLRNMYQKNLLAKPGGVTLDGVPIDLRQDRRSRSTAVRASEDHIAPWKTTYAATQLFSRPGALRAGRLGPHRRGGQPAGRQEVRLLDERRRCRPTLDAWLAGATQHPGSWWNDWDKLELSSQVRRQGAGARARRRRAAGDRGRAGQLREGARPEVQAALPLSPRSAAATASRRRAAVATARAARSLSTAWARADCARTRSISPRGLLELVRQHQARQQQQLLLAQPLLSPDQALGALIDQSRQLLHSADLARPALQAKSPAADLDLGRIYLAHGWTQTGASCSTALCAACSRRSPRARAAASSRLRRSPSPLSRMVSRSRFWRPLAS